MFAAAGAYFVQTQARFLNQIIGGGLGEKKENRKSTCEKIDLASFIFMHTEMLDAFDL